MAEEIGDKYGIVQAYMNIGLLLADRGNWDKAERYYNNSLAILEEIGDRRRMASIYIDIGDLFGDRGDWKSHGVLKHFASY